MEENQEMPVEGSFLKQKRINQWVTDTLAAAENKKERKRKRCYSDPKISYSNSDHVDKSRDIATCDFENSVKFYHVPSTPERSSKEKPGIEIKKHFRSASIGMPVSSIVWTVVQENYLKQDKSDVCVIPENVDEFFGTNLLTNTLNSDCYNTASEICLSSNSVKVFEVTKSCRTASRESKTEVLQEFCEPEDSLTETCSNLPSGKIKFACHRSPSNSDSNSSSVSLSCTLESYLPAEIMEDFKTLEHSSDKNTRNSTLDAETPADTLIQMSNMLDSLNSILRKEEKSPRSRSRMSITACRSSYPPSDVSCVSEEEIFTDDDLGISQQRWTAIPMKFSSDNPAFEILTSCNKRRFTSSNFD